jgi:hypothetical protein
MFRSISRRDFAVGSAFGLGAVLLPRYVSGQSPTGQIASVDTLSIKVLMDSNHDIFLRAPAPTAVKIKRLGDTLDALRRRKRRGNEQREQSRTVQTRVLLQEELARIVGQMHCTVSRC